MEFKLTNHEIEKIKSAYLNGEKQIDIAKKIRNNTRTCIKYNKWKKKE